MRLSSDARLELVRQREKEDVMHICLIGHGKMGQAMLAGWLASGNDDRHFSVIDPMIEANPYPGQPVTIYQSARQMASEHRPDMVVLAVKPQMMADVMSGAEHIGNADTAFLSIAAGLSTERLQQMIPQSRAVLRAMPNTPAAVGQGISALFATDNVSDSQADLAAELLSASGEVVRLEIEEQMDAVTAVSGSGPAYVFYLVEVMAAAAEKLGLPAEMAQTLARQTVIGSGGLMAADKAPASELRQNVTSKGGTTAAALSVLMAEEGMAALFETALKAAHDRGVELNKG